MLRRSANDISPDAGLWRTLPPARFLLFCSVLVAGAVGLIPVIGLTHGIMAAFDLASAGFIVTVIPLLRSEAAAMRLRSRSNDANRALLLAICIVVTLVILVAIASELPGMKSSTTVMLVVITLMLAWLFSNSVWALHYAHLYYSAADREGDAGGLSFPACGEPNYWDFVYFSFTLGMTFQTSDVAVTTTAMRRHVVAQSLASFIFNIGVLAFSINALGG